MRKLYILRHGQTLFNLRKKTQGFCDSPLTELGIRQAKAACEYFKEANIVFDGVYSSSSERCCDTTELVTDKPYTRLKGLKEWNFGILEGEPEDLQCSRNPWSGTIKNSHGDYFVRFGGESDIEVQNRLDSTISNILAKKHKTTLCVTHAGAMWLFFLKRNNLEDLNGNFFSNCCILEYDVDDDDQITFVGLISPANNLNDKL